MTTHILNITGMHCDNCVQQVTRSLSSLAGVAEAKVDLPSGTARVSHDDTACGPGELVAAVQRAGFQVNGFRAADEPA